MADTEDRDLPGGVGALQTWFSKKRSDPATKTRPKANVAIDDAVGSTYRSGDRQPLISRRALGMESPPTKAKPGRRRDQEPPEAHRPLTPQQAQLRGDAMVTRAKASMAAASAPSKAPADTASPAAKQSWWDKFGSDHKLSADKSYSDYKKLMGD